MEPKHRRRLINSEWHASGIGRLNDLMRTAIGIAGYYQTMPVDCGRLRQRVLNMHHYIVAAAKAHRRPEEWPVEAISRRQGPAAKLHCSRLRCQMYLSFSIAEKLRRNLELRSGISGSQMGRHG